MTIHYNVRRSDIESVSLDADRIYIIGKNLNQFIIPSEAFASNAERDEFVRLAREWCGSTKK